MKHNVLPLIELNNLQRLIRKTNGIFYTPTACAKFLADRILSYVHLNSDFSKFTVFDPMIGSGELLVAFCESLLEKFTGKERIIIGKQLPKKIYGTDKDSKAVERAKENLAINISKLINEEIDPESFSNIRTIDALELGKIEDEFKEIFETSNPGFSVIIANPPWEVVTVNDREFFSIYDPMYKTFNKYERMKKKQNYLNNNKINEKYSSYKNEIFESKKYIKNNYKLIGKGQINLYRVSFERIIQLGKINAIIGVITPSGLAGEYHSKKIREELLVNNKILEMLTFSIGAKIFPEADVSPMITVFSRGGKTDSFVYINDIDSIQSAYFLVNKSMEKIDTNFIKKLSPEYLTFTPIKNKSEIKILNKLYKYPVVLDRRYNEWNLDVGRELDETNDRDYIINEKTKYVFLKGKDISPFSIKIKNNKWIKKDYPKLLLEEHNKERIIWRDVARANKKRRVFTTIAPINYVLGNSLNYFKENLNEVKRHYLLGVWSSLVIEYRIRQLSTNNHINIYVTRQIPIPRLDDKNPYVKEIAKTVKQALNTFNEKLVYKIEALVASLFNLTKKEFSYILSTFPKFSSAERSKIIDIYETIQIIQNHDTASLSELDLKIIETVPEGGNWKNIPTSIPSKRLEQIRISYKKGGGSRSTYYGRLNRANPAYTISTYFTRPGNGCNIHPLQNRTLSVREAARLQSFPDWFYFYGKSKTSIYKQIGNAVPPLLAYAVAKTIPIGTVIDLFSGAGGMSLGFQLAGHNIFSSLEIDPDFIKTYSSNIPTIEDHVIGDIRQEKVANELFDLVHNYDGEINTIIGGPPCQGYSTAGNKRSVLDPRNNLYRSFIQVVQAIQPMNFVMENVPGLLTLAKGIFYQNLLREFKKLNYKIMPLTLWAHEYGVPQKRKRIFIIGTKAETYVQPIQLFSSSKKSNLPSPITVGDALEYLPEISYNKWNNERYFVYSHSKNYYGKWLRGQISAAEMLDEYGGHKNKEQKSMKNYFQ